LAVTVLYVVRHGQSTWNAAGLLQGQTPDPELTPLGHEQAREAAVALAGTSIDAICSSDLRRAVQTATPIADRHGMEIHLMPGLRERAYGLLEGHPSADAIELAGDIDWLDPDVRPGGGESLRDVHTRVGDTVSQCVDAHSDGAVVLISHGDTIQVIAAWVAGLGPHEIPWADVANGSVTVLDSRMPPFRF
jgi:broad specificity phosphatase PhoE